ncbi:sugar-transfer associated ATP-grasp domain-containing protein [Natronogracilivirga saccharolytica]|uniref:Alpha-L-glutamate ligase-related protein ATP-grasp domain-containing protein n=1 Tax=Natronogracilivirga saccharolytica TaxID=2812953 RepID=A0A8J7RQ31_9BACT|nr:sugar-transfer associated ATP-grasp domain-containing protein [Natronogracilivirga saccharolytica]MBP3193849.1 hypothetical protein [Natronogracilivirga saccharolytica]
MKVAKEIVKKILNGFRRRRHRQECLKLFRANNNIHKKGSKNYEKRIQSYWKQHYGKKVNPIWHFACANVIGKEDERYLPHTTYINEIIPFLNDFLLKPAYIDKNMADVLLHDETIRMLNVIKCMHGNYYDKYNNPIDRNSIINILINDKVESFIVKGTRTDNGVGIKNLEIINKNLYKNKKLIQIDDLEKIYGKEFVIQQKMSQHPVLAEPHPSSLNTIRLATLRWEGEIFTLLAIAKFGVDGKITDNAGTEGIWCGINNEGLLNDSAVDKKGNHLRYHPTTGYDFKNRKTIPKFDELREYGKKLHQQVYHFDFVSWDFPVDVNGNPVFLEMNLRGGASWLYQFASRKPIFDEFTKDILQRIKSSASRS